MDLPEKIENPKIENPRDLVIIGQPKIGKGTILGKFTTEYNGLVFDLERGGYEYIPARKIEIYQPRDINLYTAYNNYLTYRKKLIENKGKYDYLIIDGLSDLDNLSEIGGTIMYQESIQGKHWNRKSDKTTYLPEDNEWKSVLLLPDGAGYLWTRRWFMNQIEVFSQISPYRIYVAHVADKYIKDNGKEEVIGSEISLTGKLKTIFASRMTGLAKLIADGDERYLNFDVQNDSIISGCRHPELKGKILISKMENDKIITFWDKIYKK